MEILNLNIVGFYSYKPDIVIKEYEDNIINSENKDIKCNICLRSIYDPSYETISNNNNILNDTNVELGKCGHLFHSDCINTWLKKNQICPIDKVLWCRHRTINMMDTNKKYNKQKYKNMINNININNININNNEEIINEEIINEEIINEEIINEEIINEEINEIASDIED